MSYTKGPWQKCTCGRCNLVWAADGETVIHDRPDNDEGNRIATGEEAQANDSLIAAAPDMLEALRHPVRKDIDSNGNVCIRIPLEQYIAILSKAEGGEA